MDARPIGRGTVLAGHLNSYVIEGVIDSGGVGKVLSGQRLSDREKVAVKVLHGGRFPITDVAKLRFREEINRSLQFDHPNLVRSLDYGNCQGVDFLVMEYVGGGTVAHRIRKKDYSDATAFRWCAEILRGLRYLHEQGCVHRDLKPNNILLTPTETAKIADLGILRDTTADAHLTLSGDQMGSVLYISPHQREHPELADAADDAYSACCCFHEILSRQRMHVYPVDLSEASHGTIPRYVCDLIMGCLAGFEPEETLKEMGECFTVKPDGVGELSSVATSEFLNGIHILPSARACNTGLARRRMEKEVAPRLEAEIEINIGHGGIAFLDEETILADGWEHVGESPGKAETKQLLNCLRLESGGLHVLSKVESIDAWYLAAAPQGLAVLAVRAAMQIFRCTDARTPVCTHRWPEYRVGAGVGPEHIFYASGIARHPERPLVALVSYGYPPLIVDPVEGSIVPLSSCQLAKDYYYPSVTFLGSRRLAVSVKDAIVIIDCDWDERTSTVSQRVPFPDDVMSLSSSPDGIHVYVASASGLAVLDTRDSSMRWLMHPPAAVIWQMSVHPRGRYMAAIPGTTGSGRGRVEIIDCDGVVVVELPDAGPGDSLRSAHSVQWSPSGNRLAVADNWGLSVFRAGP